MEVKKQVSQLEQPAAKDNSVPGCDFVGDIIGVTLWEKVDFTRNVHPVTKQIKKQNKPRVGED